MKLDTRKIALISVFAAVQVVISRLPGIPVMGVESGKIEPTVLLIPIIGVILGPWMGALAAFLGGFVAWLIPSITFFGMLMLPTGPIGAFVAGALARNDKKSNWKVAALTLLVLITLYYLSPVGAIVPYYAILHLVALALILIFRGKTLNLLRSDNRQRLTWGTTIASFSGIMANHMAGTLIYIASIIWFLQLKGIKDAVRNVGFSALKSGLPKLDPTGLEPLLYWLVPISAVERLVMTAITVIVGTGVIFVLKNSGIITLGKPSIE